MIGGIKNVLTVDEKLTVNLQRRRQLAVCSRCLEPQRQKLHCRLLTASLAVPRGGWCWKRVAESNGNVIIVARNAEIADVAHAQIWLQTAQTTGVMSSGLLVANIMSSSLFRLSLQMNSAALNSLSMFAEVAGMIRCC